MKPPADWFKATIEALTTPVTEDTQFDEGYACGREGLNIELTAQSEDFKAGYAQGWKDRNGR